MWRFGDNYYVCVPIKAALISLLSAAVASHLNVLLSVVFTFVGLLSGCMLYAYGTHEADYTLHYMSFS